MLQLVSTLSRGQLYHICTHFLFCRLLFPISLSHLNGTELNHICLMSKLSAGHLSLLHGNGISSPHKTSCILFNNYNCCPVPAATLIVLMLQSQFTKWSNLSAQVTAGACENVWDQPVVKSHFSGILHFIIRMTSSKKVHPLSPRWELNPGLPHHRLLEVIITGLYPQRKPPGHKAASYHISLL